MNRRLPRSIQWAAHLDFRGLTALIVTCLMISYPSATWADQVTGPPKPPLAREVFQPLKESLQLSYLELFNQAATLEFSPPQIELMRKYLKEARGYCTKQWNQKIDAYERDLHTAQAELKQRTANLSRDERKQFHCRIQNLRIQKGDAEMLVRQAIPIAYENRLAKLDVIEKWPAEKQKIEEEKRSGIYRQRRYGDVEDIGFRDVGRGQEKDIKVGRETVRQMKLAGLMPREVKNEAVQRYVTKLERKIAAHSDLRVPVQVTVLDSKEINAFALPGGFVFVQRGLLEAVEDESQLAGVLAHETAHAAARHGHRLMKRATIASVIYQAAEIGAMVLTGGVASIGAYYALQYGFYGLGMVLSLQMLGVSRECELEADQLGIQYAWNAGYDPTGFIRFFDKMATREGYVQGLSWFRTHPPFYQRMVDAEREISFLPKKENLVRQTPAFEQMKKELAKVTAQAKEDEQGRPSLLAPEQGCPAPPKVGFKPGERRIETVCPLPEY